MIFLTDIYIQILCFKELSQRNVCNSKQAVLKPRNPSTRSPAAALCRPAVLLLLPQAAGIYRINHGIRGVSHFSPEPWLDGELPDVPVTRPSPALKTDSSLVRLWCPHWEPRDLPPNFYPSLQKLQNHSASVQRPRKRALKQPSPNSSAG